MRRFWARGLERPRIEVDGMFKGQSELPKKSAISTKITSKPTTCLDRLLVYEDFAEFNVPL